MFSSSEEHPKTRHEIKIARRVCRYLLISMKEQDKQLLNVHVACFADHTLTDPVELEGAAAYDKAWAFMTEIGGKFLRDEITPATIKATAKTMMESRGIPTRVPNHISKIVKKTLKRSQKAPQSQTPFVKKQRQRSPKNQPHQKKLQQSATTPTSPRTIMTTRSRKTLAMMLSQTTAWTRHDLRLLHHRS